MLDIISRQAAIDAINEYCTEAPEYMQGWAHKLTEAVKGDIAELISELPSVTMYGYNIEHLLFFAKALEEKNIPPEYVADMVKDIGRVIEYAIDSFNAFIEKTLKDQMSRPEPPKQEENGTD